MRMMKSVLTLTAAAALASVGCAKKAKPAATVATTPAPARPAATQDQAPSEASISTDDPTGTAPPSGPIYFEFDSAVLTPASRELLSTFATWAIEHAPALRIEGHTDAQGTTEYNLALGDRRARAVADYLIALGVDRAKVDTVTFGEERPAVTGEDENAHARNRRGEIKTN